MDLNKVKLGLGIRGEIHLYRHGKKPNEALDKRGATRDVLTAICEYMMCDCPKGSVQQVKLADKYFEISVNPISVDDFNKNK